MPPVIPKYQREQLRVPDAIAKQGGAADKAAARGQQGIAQAYSGVSQAYGQSAGQESQAMNMEIGNLKNRLSEFNTMLDNTTSQVAQQYARREGVKDVAKRRQEIIELRNKYQNNPEKMQEEIAKVTTASMQDDFSLYGRVYSSTVNAAYANQVESDARNIATDAEYQSNGNPELFKDMYQTYQAKFINDAPNQIGAITAQKAFDKYGTSIYRGMHTSQNNKFATQQDKNNKNAITGLQGLINDTSQRGQSVETNALQGQLAGMTQGMVNSGKMHPAEALFINQTAYNTAQTNEFMRYGTEEVNNGRGWDFLTKIQNKDHEYGKAFDALPADVQVDVVSQMTTAAKNHQEQRTAKQKQENIEIDIAQVEETRNLKLDQLEGRKYQPEELQKKYLAGDITSTQRDELLESQKVISDDDVLTVYSNNRMLVSISEDDLLYNPKLSNEDKRMLMDKREGAMKSKTYLWTASDNYKQVMDRIKDDYGVKDNMLVVMQAKMKSERTPTEQNYIEFKRELWDRVEALPFEQRVEGVKEVYNKLTTEFAGKAQEVSNTTLENRNTSDWNTAKAKADQYNENKWGWQDAKTPASVLKEEGWEDMKIEKLEGKFGTAAAPKKDPLLKPTQRKPKPMIIYNPMSVNMNGTRPSSPTTPTTNVKTGTPARNLPVLAYGTTNVSTGRVGGSKSWRNRNPFNISAEGNGKYYPGAIGRAASTVGDTGDKNMLIFETEEAGVQGFIDLVYRRYDDAPIEQTFAKYQTQGFDGKLASLRQAGVPTDVRFSELDSTQQLEFLKVWKRHEGYKVGSTI